MFCFIFDQKNFCMNIVKIFFLSKCLINEKLCVVYINLIRNFLFFDIHFFLKHNASFFIIHSNINILNIKFEKNFYTFWIMIFFIHFHVMFIVFVIFQKSFKFFILFFILVMNKAMTWPATRCTCTWCWLRTHQSNQLMKSNHLIYSITFNCFDCGQTRRTILMCLTRHHHLPLSPPTTIINGNGLNEV